MLVLVRGLLLLLGSSEYSHSLWNGEYLAISILGKNGQVGLH